MIFYNLLLLWQQQIHQRNIITTRAINYQPCYHNYSKPLHSETKEDKARSAVPLCTTFSNLNPISSCETEFPPRVLTPNDKVYLRAASYFEASATRYSLPHTQHQRQGDQRSAIKMDDKKIEIHQRAIARSTFCPSFVRTKCVLCRRRSSPEPTYTRCVQKITGIFIF